MADGSEPTAVDEEKALLSWLDNLIGWMRNRGVRRFRQGDVELELDPEYLPTEELKARREVTQEEITARKRERKRERYRLELGYAPPDELLDKLP